MHVPGHKGRMQAAGSRVAVGRVPGAVGRTGCTVGEELAHSAEEAGAAEGTVEVGIVVGVADTAAVAGAVDTVAVVVADLVVGEVDTVVVEHPGTDVMAELDAMLAEKSDVVLAQMMAATVAAGTAVAGSAPAAGTDSLS